jgi:hypothetical protein
MKRFSYPKFFVLVLILISISTVIQESQLNAKCFKGIRRGERGDTIPETTLSDSDYVKNMAIVRFHKKGLIAKNLCYTLPEKLDTIIGSNGDTILRMPSWFMSYLYAQELKIDTLIENINLLNAIRSFGGTHFKRISIANPCTDSISIARNGDTLRDFSYLYMTLHFNNDTSVLKAIDYICSNFKDEIFEIEVNGIIRHDDTTTSIQELSYEKHIEMSIFPNPTNSIASINYNLSQTDDINISIIDAMGKIHNSISLGVKSIGRYNYSLSVDNLTSGIYYCVIKGKNSQSYQKLVIIE